MSVDNGQIENQIDEGLQRIVCEHPFFTGLDSAFCNLVCGCAKNVRFETGQYLLREGESADQLFLLRHGRVSLEISAPSGTLTIQTLNPGDAVGISWLIPPYRWVYDAKALEPVRAISIDATCLRRKCESDHDLGYEMMKRVVPMLINRLQNTRLQMLDVYGK